MDKYEYKVRSEEIKELIARREYVQAAEIADTIDWRRVKSVMMLCTISDLYKINRRYEDSRDLLLLAYDRHPGGRTIVYALCELAIKMGELTQALEYCKEYMQIAPRDPGRYILQYKIYEAQEVSLEERIAVLEELKKRDYREKWAYELAYLYHRIGLASKCVDECDEMIVWFGDGKYVIKAMELKMLHQPLTPQQQAKYDSRFAPQEEMYTVVEEIPEQVQEEPAAAEAAVDEVPVPDERVPAEEMDIQVKTMDPGQCNTINLQEEVAAGLRELLDGKSQDGEITRSIMAPMLETDRVDSQAVEEALAAEPVREEVQETEPPAAWEEAEAEPAEPDALEEVTEIQETTSTAAESKEPIGEEPQETVETAESVRKVQQSAEASEAAGEAAEEDKTAVKVMEQLRQESMAEPPKEMAEVLSMEADGQISFVMPEKEAVEKQITGQISIADIMAEWERMKKELEEKGKEKVRQHVKENTGQMFTEFEASVRDGLLEQLERGREPASVIAEAEGRSVDEDDIPVPPSLLEEEVTEAPEEEELVESYEEISAEEAEDAVEEISQEPAAEEYAEEELQEPVTEEYTEEVSYEPTAEEYAEEELQEPVTEEYTEVSYEPTAKEYAEEELQEPVIEELAEAALTAEDEVEELVEIEALTGEEPASEPAEAEDTPAADREVLEEAAAEEDLNDVDAAYEAALMGAEDAGEEQETGIDYETISMPTGEVEIAVQQEAARQRNLTREERELFSPYIQGRTSKVQLIHTIDNISMAAYTGNVVITGAEGMDTLGLAKNIIRNIQLTDSNFSGKIAKISGESLNKRDVAAVLEGLDNGALIIQKANAMNTKTVESLYKALQQEHRGIVVIMEGTKKALNAFLDKHEKLQACFNGRIDMEALSDAALVAFGKKYAREKEYSIDEFGVLALHRMITDRQTSDHAVTIMEVKEIIDAAIESANRKTIGHFFDVLMAKRYDDEDMIIIREKDFM